MTFVIDKSWCTYTYSIYVYLNFYILKQKLEASLYIPPSSHTQTLRWDWDKVDHHALQCLRKTSNQMKMDFVRFIVTTQLIMHDRDIYWAHFTRTPLSNWTNRVIVPLPKVGQLLSGEQISEEGSVCQTMISSRLHPCLDRPRQMQLLLKLFHLNWSGFLQEYKKE